MLFKIIYIFSFRVHFDQQSRTNLAVLVKGIRGNIHVQLFKKFTSGSGGNVV